MRQSIIVLTGIVILIMATSFAVDCGDVNNDGSVNILDIVYLIDYKYKGAPAPDQQESADVNSDGMVNILDIVYLINYKYKASAAPDCGTLADVDGNVYQTVKIGNQMWMAENLKVTHYRNGDPIPNVIDNAEWTGLTSGAYCEYKSDVNNVATYGRLYNWYAVDDSRNIAPDGWHVPTDAEWKQLEMYLGMSQPEVDATGERGTDEGGKLKEIGTIHWYNPNTGAINEGGFSGLPSGFRYDHSGSYAGMGYLACHWSSSELSGQSVWDRSLSYNYSGVYRHSSNKLRGLSVRCVRD
jgi:uncharacterized protein (TIGR02145 family)